MTEFLINFILVTGGLGSFIQFLFKEFSKLLSFICVSLTPHKIFICFISRENTKEKDKTEGTAEEIEEREQVIPRGRKTANSQGRRKGRITRSMTSEAAAASAAAAAATEEPPPPLPPPPEPGECTDWSEQATVLVGILSVSVLG